MNMCTIAGCDKTCVGRGLCRKHHSAWYRTTISGKASHAKYENTKARAESYKKYRSSGGGKLKTQAREKKNNGTKSRTHNGLMPSWADQLAIKLFYINCPKGYEVDHIIPKHGVLVTGLHVANNLQYLKPQENIVKSNKFPCVVTLRKGKI